MLSVLILDNDQQMLDEWGYVLPAFGFKPAQCWVPFPKAFKWRSVHPIPQDRPLMIFQPDDGEYIKGETSLIDVSFDEDAMLVFGPTHGHMTAELLDDHLSEWESRHELIYIPHSPTWAMHGPNAGAVVLYEWRRRRGIDN